MEDLDLGTRLGRIEAKIDGLVVSLLGKDETLKDHERRMRYLERFVYGVSAVITTIITVVGISKAIVP